MEVILREKGIYNCIEYRITEVTSYRAHWFCAYIKPPNGVTFTYDGNFIDNFDVHGSVTFNAMIEDNDDYKQEFTTGFWIGWDYAHAGDYFHIKDENTYGDHEWTLEEVFEEVKEAIEDILSIVQNN